MPCNANSCRRCNQIEQPSSTAAKHPLYNLAVLPCFLTALLTHNNCCCCCCCHCCHCRSPPARPPVAPSSPSMQHSHQSGPQHSTLVRHSTSYHQHANPTSCWLISGRVVGRGRPMSMGAGSSSSSSKEQQQAALLLLFNTCRVFHGSSSSSELCW